MDKVMNPIGQLMGLRYKSHPWHGVNIGDNAPELITCFVEMVPTDTVKFEIDKKTGYLRVDRPQKYSNIIPALYGFVPQTYCNQQVGEYCNEKTGRTDIEGDQDPLDVCILTEKSISHGDILVWARPIGGFRFIDDNQADDKVVCVLENDAVYGRYKDISDCSQEVIERLQHYFLTYKDLPGKPQQAEITHVYGIEEAHEVIRRSITDYKTKFENLYRDLSTF